ncbi:hypothetical protein D3C87_1667120 [compost metagenome]
MAIEAASSARRLNLAGVFERTLFRRNAPESVLSDYPLLDISQFKPTLFAGVTKFNDGWGLVSMYSRECAGARNESDNLIHAVCGPPIAVCDGVSRPDPGRRQSSQHPGDHGRRCGLVEYRRLQPRHDGRQNPQP